MSRNILMQVVFSIVVLWVATHFTRQAKAQATNGIISGTVTDASGAAVPGVTIQVKNVNTGVTRTVLTNEQGRYRVPDLLVGAYEVQGALPGFQTVVQRGIPLTVGSERVVDFSLQVGQPETTVTVEGEIAQVDTTSTAIASLIEQKQIADLPLNGRNYTQLIALAPGVQQAAPGTSGFYGRGANFSVAGARPEGQAFLLDNTNVQDFWNHGPGSAVLGTTLGVEAIAEFSTQTNTYGAQFGGAGAAINAVTRSGTNQFHGSVFEYFRNSVLDARGPFDGPKLPTFRQNQFGASLGGPIRKNKTFFFTNYEGLRRLNVFKNNPSLRNFDPRFGFAYDPFNDHKTSIRGGFGVFHNPVQPRTVWKVVFLFWTLTMLLAIAETVCLIAATRSSSVV